MTIRIAAGSLGLLAFVLVQGCQTAEMSAARPARGLASDGTEGERAMLKSATIRIAVQ